MEKRGLGRAKRSHILLGSEDSVCVVGVRAGGEVASMGDTFEF